MPSHEETKIISRLDQFIEKHPSVDSEVCFGNIVLATAANKYASELRECINNPKNKISDKALFIKEKQLQFPAMWFAAGMNKELLTIIYDFALYLQHQTANLGFKVPILTLLMPNLNRLSVKPSTYPHLDGTYYNLSALRRLFDSHILSDDKKKLIPIKALLDRSISTGLIQSRAIVKSGV